MWCQKTPLNLNKIKISNSSAGKLGNSLGTLRDGVLGKLPWKRQSYSGLNLARGNLRISFQKRNIANHFRHWNSWSSTVKNVKTVKNVSQNVVLMVAKEKLTR